MQYIIKMGEKTKKNLVLMILLRIMKINPISPKIESRALCYASFTLK
jgi:hypothetical protein